MELFYGKLSIEVKILLYQYNLNLWVLSTYKNFILLQNRVKKTYIILNHIIIQFDFIPHLTYDIESLNSILLVKFGRNFDISDQFCICALYFYDLIFPLP